MNEGTGEMSGEGLDAQVEEAERRLKAAADSVAAAERRATAEIQALETDLERERLRTAEALEKLRAEHEKELRQERDAKARAIAAAEDRLSEIETQVEAAERAVEEAERRGAEAEKATDEATARSREAAAAWLRGQVDAIRREAERR
jgi:chromosome segregation ATPase